MARKSKREKEGERERGWRREARDKENLEEICEREMKRWGEEYGKSKFVDGELAWRTWLQTHNRIAEKAVGRYARRKKRSWEKGEWDQDVFEALREKNRLRREMGRRGEKGSGGRIQKMERESEENCKGKEEKKAARN